MNVKVMLPGTVYLEGSERMLNTTGELKPEIHQHLALILEAEGYTVNPQNLIEILFSGKKLQETIVERYRWSVTCEHVVEIHGKLFQYTNEHAMGDSHLSFDFNLGTVIEVRKVKKEVFVYEKLVV